MGVFKYAPAQSPNAAVARSPRLLLLLGCLGIWVLACFLAGCGDGRPRRVPVSGRVLIDGQPLTAGHVRFVPENDRPSSGQIGPDGRFTLGCFEAADGAVTGKHRVAVIANQPIDETTMRWLAPEHYADHTTSGLVVDVTGPTDSLEIKISAGAARP